MYKFNESEMVTSEPYETAAPTDETVSNERMEVGEDTLDAAPSSSSIRGISINPLNSGYMVKVGCQSVAVESTEKLVDMLNKYLSDPSGFERKWFSKDVRNRLENI